MRTKDDRLPTASHARILSGKNTGRCLDAARLNRFEQALRAWAVSPRRADLVFSRRRVLLIYLLIRYTGARLNEVLDLDLAADFDPRRHAVRFRKDGRGVGRWVHLPEAVSAEIGAAFPSPAAAGADSRRLRLDPAHVRRKFYERAEEAGIPRTLGAPEIIRRSRAVELMQANLPLPVVQQILGHATPNRAASYVKFSAADMQRVEAFFVARENRRRTSARNAFYGKIEALTRGDVQARIEIATPAGFRLHAVITRDSLVRLGLKPGAFIAAEVKAPWVALHASDPGPACSADNLFQARVVRILKGRVSSEVVARIADGTAICASLTTQCLDRLGLRKGDGVWVAFNAFAVVLHAD